jgi:MarR family transcriptional repressor of emrRAB
VSLPPIEALEAGARRIAARIPEVPLDQTLAVRLMILLGREMSARLDQWLRPAGLTEVELRALVTVFSQGDAGSFPGELCEALGQSPANITRVTDALVARALITRVPSDEDRRRMELRVTQSGAELVRDVLPRLGGFSRELLADFDAAELEQLLGGLRRLVTALEGVAQHTPTEQG